MAEEAVLKKANKKCTNKKVVSVICILSGICCLLSGSYLFSRSAFQPHKVAVDYVDTIVQTADGYNAYKYTLVSKNMNYRDFIRENYINPVIYRDTEYVTGGSTDGLNGYNDESFKGEKALSDNEKYMRYLINGMYIHYVELVRTYGWDNYDAIYSEYLQYLITVREEIFGDEYLSEEVFFTCFEDNVKHYGEKLTGTEEEKTGVQTSGAPIGFYEEYYGEDYTLTAVRVAEPVSVDIEAYRASADKAVFETYGINTDDISEVRTFEIAVKNQKGETVTECSVTVCKIGLFWYVDNTVTDTSSLYDFFFNI